MASLVTVNMLNCSGAVIGRATTVRGAMSTIVGGVAYARESSTGALRQSNCSAPANAGPAVPSAPGGDVVAVHLTATVAGTASSRAHRAAHTGPLRETSRGGTCPACRRARVPMTRDGQIADHPRRSTGTGTCSGTGALPANIWGPRADTARR